MGLGVGVGDHERTQLKTPPKIFPTLLPPLPLRNGHQLPESPRGVSKASFVHRILVHATAMRRKGLRDLPERELAVKGQCVVGLVHPRQVAPLRETLERELRSRYQCGGFA